MKHTCTNLLKIIQFNRFINQLIQDKDKGKVRVTCKKKQSSHKKITYFQLLWFVFLTCLQEGRLIAA